MTAAPPAAAPQEVWITGIGLVSSLGEGAAPHLAATVAAPAGQYFVMGNLATRIEELVAAKKVGA